MMTQIGATTVDTQVMWSAAVKLQVRTGSPPPGLGKDKPLLTELMSDIAGVCKTLQATRSAQWIPSDCGQRFPDISELARTCPYCGIEVPKQAQPLAKGSSPAGTATSTKREVQAAVDEERSRSLNERIDAIHESEAQGVLASWQIGDHFLTIKRAKLHEADTTVVEKNFARWCALRFPQFSSRQVERMMTFANSVKLAEVKQLQKLGHVGWERIRQGLLLIEDDKSARAQRDPLIKCIVAQLEELPNPTAQDAEKVTSRVVAEENRKRAAEREEERVQKPSTPKAEPAAGKKKPGRPAKPKDEKPAKGAKEKAPKKEEEVRRTPERMIVLSGSLPVDFEIAYRNAKSGLVVPKPAGKIAGRMLELVFKESKQVVRLYLGGDVVKVKIEKLKGLVKA